MKSEVKIFLLGFAPFEKATFESFFRLAGRRDTQYVVVPEVVHAQVLMVNSDNPKAAQWVNAPMGPLQKVLFVGAADPSGKWPATPRPIRLTSVLGLLDVLMRAGKQVADEPLSATTQAAVIAPAEPVVPVPAAVTTTPARLNSVRQGSGSKSNSAFASSSFLGLGADATPVSSAQKYDDILVVDDSDIALKFMQNRLTRYGFRAELVKSGEEALSRVSAETYKFVFLDVMMEGLDGYQTCRAIKQRKYASGKAPVVVMLTSRGGSIDKIRGGLAGCDAYLTKPLNEAELLKVLSKYDEQVERSFRDTNSGGSGFSSMRMGQ